jgi:5-methylthioadenosine/S-adenosylhomocysteine deaminase
MSANAAAGADRWLLRGRQVISDAFSDAVPDGAVLIENGIVESIGPFRALSRMYPLARVRSEGANTLMPGLIDSHSHGRALPLDAQGVKGQSLEQFLLRIPAMTPLDACDDAFVAGADLLCTGVTTAQINFHAFAEPDVYVALADRALAGLKKSQIRVAFVPCVMEQNELWPDELLPSAPGQVATVARSVKRATTGEAYFAAFGSLRRRHADRESSGKLAFALGPCAAQWCSEQTLRQAGRMLTDGARAQIHLLETPVQRSAAYGEPAIEKLVTTGVFSPQLSAAHGVWLTDEEIGVVARNAVTLVHCPASNARLRSGTARIRQWLDTGVQVGFGLDSNSNSNPPDFFAELRFAAEVAEAVDGPLTRTELFSMATSGGAAAVGMTGQLGQLRPGAKADVISLALSPRKSGKLDPVAHVLATATRSSVVNVWVAGQQIVDGGTHARAADVERARQRLKKELDTDARARARRMRQLRACDCWIEAELGRLCRAGAGRGRELTGKAHPHSTEGQRDSSKPPPRGFPDEGGSR